MHRVAGRAPSIVAVLALVGAASVTLGAGASGAGPEVPRCAGHPATIVGSRDEAVIRATPHRDVIWAGPGEHEILGLGGSDVICAGPGDDVIYGGGGNDLIYGGAGHDTIYGGGGDDTVRGGRGADVIYGGRGDDTLVGGRAGGNVLYGGAGDDSLNGGGGNGNILRGGLGIDVLRGGGGDGNILDGGYGWDIIDGGSGHDNTASFAAMPRSNLKGGGVWASLESGRAFGDGRDKLRHVENLEGSAFDDTLIGNRHANKLYGGPGDDTLIGGGGDNTLDGGSGSDRCRGAPRRRRSSCGPQRTPRASAQVYFESGADPAAAGVVVASGSGNDEISVGFDAGTDTLGITAKRGIAVHPPCTRPGAALTEAICPLGGLPRWLTVDLGPGNDRFRVIGSLVGIGEVRVDGGPGNDVLRGGPEEDLLEGGPGADRLYGGGGSDALVGGVGGPNLLEGGPGGDLLAAGSPCAGGRIVGGSGRNDVSFAELPLQPGVLYASLARGIAYVQGVPDCHPVHISHSVRDLEGSFGPDVLIGDRRANHIIGQGGADRIYGGGGEDVIDARDGVRDALIQCGFKGHPAGLALIDRADPRPLYCAHVEVGKPIPGLPRFPAQPSHR
jgi:Ca2+-binding RTX toxin-like protein